jgi:hypothetical protein
MHSSQLVHGATKLKLPGQNLKHRGYTMDYLIHIAGPAALVSLGGTFLILSQIWPNS